MTNISLKVINKSLKLFKALLVNRLQVPGGAIITKHQFGGHCNPPFPGKCRTRVPYLLLQQGEQLPGPGTHTNI